MPIVVVSYSLLAHFSFDTSSYPTTVRILSESMTGPIDMDNLDIGKCSASITCLAVHESIQLTVFLDESKRCS
jgi:hypothetical protein